MEIPPPGRPVRPLSADRIHRRLLPLIALLAGLSTAGVAEAGKVYRCGNAFQDLPCPEIKVADARAPERPAARDPLPCAGGKDAGRGDCTARPTPESRSPVMPSKP